MEKMDNPSFDVAILGGGLSGLTLSILLGKSGLNVVLVEKNTYPFHRVCGEYISNESRNFLEKIGLPFQELDLPGIDRLTLSAPNGFSIHSQLDLGGFGISRYLLDHKLMTLARNAGVKIWQECKATQVVKQENQFQVHTTNGTLNSTLVCGSFGKYNPSFLEDPDSKIRSQYIGVKYHIRHSHDRNRISLHNFRDGYCGISKVENDVSCLCYLTTSSNLKKNGNQIRKMEEEVLFQNPHLKRIFENAEFLFDQPLVISNIHFQPRKTVQNEILMLGDSAGTIAPLCGNGMSMAFHSASILAPLIERKLNEKKTFNWLESNYNSTWNQTFENRIVWGNRLQNLFGNPQLTFAALALVGSVPPLFQKLISLTHGKSF